MENDVIKSQKCNPRIKIYISDVPEALEVYIGNNVDKVTVGSNKKVAWKCQEC